MAIEFATPVIGVLDSAELSASDYERCLSEAERDQISRVRNPLRRRERLAGRIAAKFLFLQRRLASPMTRDLHLLKINRSALDRISPSLFRQVLITPPDQGTGAPRISWCMGQRIAEKAAISHTDGLACVLLGDSEACSVDFEKSEARISSFYRHYFTPREKEWAAACVRRYGLNSTWAYTVLWSMKECVLKTGAFAHLTVWNISSLEMNILTGSEELREPHDANELREKFVYLDTEVSDGNRIVAARMAISGTACLVLTASIDN